MITYDTREKLTDNDLTGIAISDLKHNLRIYETEEFDPQLQVALDSAISVIEKHWLCTTIVVNKYSLSYPNCPGVMLVQGDVSGDVVVKVDGVATTDFSIKTNDALGRSDRWVWFQTSPVGDEITIEADIGFAPEGKNFKAIKQAVMLLGTSFFNEPAAYSPAGMNMNPAFKSLIGHLRPQVLV